MRFRKVLPIIGVIVAVGAAFAPAAAATPEEPLCAEFGSQADAQALLRPGDPKRLDPNGNGVACETNPCPCAYVDSRTDSPGSFPAAAPPHPLTNRVARNISKRLGRGVVVDSVELQRSYVNECRRLSSRRIGCSLTIRGKSQKSKITCEYRVDVRARQGRYVGRIVAQRCRQQSLAKLTYKRALRAFETRLEELVDMPTLVALFRTSRTSFVGNALWKPHADRDDFCVIQATIEFSSSRLVLVTTDPPVCLVSA